MSGVTASITGFSPGRGRVIQGNDFINTGKTALGLEELSKPGMEKEIKKTDFTF